MGKMKMELGVCEERVKKAKGWVGIMNGSGWIDEIMKEGQKVRKGEDRRIARMCFRGCVYVGVSVVVEVVQKGKGIER